MPATPGHRARIQWRLDGNPDLPALVLGNAWGTDIGLWDDVMPRLLRHFHVLRYDPRGHGASQTPDGQWEMQDLADDLAAVVDAAGLTRFHYCGISMGALTGLAYAARRPPALASLMLAQGTLRYQDPEIWRGLAAAIEKDGPAALVPSMAQALFSPGFTARAALPFQRWRTSFLQQDPAGLAKCCTVLAHADLRQAASRTGVRTLVTMGRHDRVTPLAAGDALADAIEGAARIVLPTAHLAISEAPIALVDALLAFMLPTDHEHASAQAERGDARRRQILGSAHVDASQARATAFNAPFQALITRYAWDEIWSSSRIDDLTRRCLTMMATLAMGRWEEYELHIIAALREGVEWQLIQDLLLQAAIYCGVPTANTGFKLAIPLLARHDAESAAAAGDRAA